MNPFTNARIVSHDTDPAKYADEPEKRGSPKFTMRSHVLSELLRNARRWVDGYESPESKAKDYGDRIDCLLLTPTFWHKRFAVLPNDKPRRPSETQRNAKDPSKKTLEAIEWWDNWNEHNKGKAQVDTEELGEAQAAVKVLRAHEKVEQLLERSKRQVWIAAEYVDKACVITVPIKCCIDIMPDRDHPIFGDALADLKTARNVGPRQFARAVFDYNYDLQAALELDLLEATGDKRTQFFHLAQENYPPYHCRMPALAQAFIERGRMRYQFALAKYCRCLVSGHWPGYDEVEWPITTPEPWMLDQATLYGELDEEPEEKPEPPSDDLMP